MEHMKRMLFVIVAVVAAGAGLMYVHKNMYKSCGSEDVKIQNLNSQQPSEDTKLLELKQKK